MSAGTQILQTGKCYCCFLGVVEILSVGNLSVVIPRIEEEILEMWAADKLLCSLAVDTQVMVDTLYSESIHSSLMFAADSLGAEILYQLTAMVETLRVSAVAEDNLAWVGIH